MRAGPTHRVVGPLLHPLQEEGPVLDTAHSAAILVQAVRSLQAARLHTLPPAWPCPLPRCVLVGIAPGAPERPQLVKGFMQLYSVEQARSQALEAHAAAFTTLQLGGKAAPVISFAQKTLAGGAVVSKLHVIELGQPGQTSLKKSAELFFPPEFADDFPVSMQIRWGAHPGARFVDGRCRGDSAGSGAASSTLSMTACAAQAVDRCLQVPRRWLAQPGWPAEQQAQHGSASRSEHFGRALPTPTPPQAHTHSHTPAATSTAWCT